MGTVIGIQGVGLDPGTPQRVSALVAARDGIAPMARPTGADASSWTAASALTRSGPGRGGGRRRGPGVPRLRQRRPRGPRLRTARSGLRPRGRPVNAVVVTAPGQWAVSDVPDPVPGPGEVVVEVERCGVCGTDLHVVDGDGPALAYPVIPGHEFSAHVVALGDGVSAPQRAPSSSSTRWSSAATAGRAAAAGPTCAPTAAGLGRRPTGRFARYVKVEANQCEPVPQKRSPRPGPP